MQASARRGQYENFDVARTAVTPFLLKKNGSDSSFSFYKAAQFSYIFSKSFYKNVAFVAIDRVIRIYVTHKFCTIGVHR